MTKSLLLWVSLSFFPAVSQCIENPPVTVGDCVRTRRIVTTLKSGGVKLSPDGEHVAYIVRAANSDSNHNDYQLYVRDLDETARRQNGRLLLRADALSGLKWLGDSRRIAVLSQTGRRSEVSFINASTGKRVVEISRPTAIEDYSTNASGEIIAFAVEVRSAAKRVENYQQLHGYAQVFGKFEEDSAANSRYEIYLTKKTRSGHRELTKIVNDGPGTQSGSPAKTFFPYLVGNLSFSPDGNYLTFFYFLKFAQDAIPENWMSNPYVRISREYGSLQVLGLYDLRAQHVRLALDSPHADDRVSWSEDSRAFFVSVYPPVHDDYWKTIGSESMHADMNGFMTKRHIYTVDVLTGVVSQVLPGFSEEGDAPVSWKRAEGEMILSLDEKTYMRMIRDGGRWRESSRFTSQMTGSSTASRAITGNSDVLVGVYETTMIPPDLFLQKIGSGQTTLLTDLNPELRHAALGEVEPIEWANKYGARTTGYLIKPVGYQEGKRYPLIILSYGWTAEFLCDGSISHTTAFPPQPLAVSGFLVLLANFPDDKNQPTEYPGELGQAYNHIAMIESAVTVLADRGMADRDNVGVIGWSRTSWKTDFLLTHSDVKLAAASSADGGAYNYGAYWLLIQEGGFRDDETIYGGPPYGKTFSNWLKYAPAFNANRVKTPVLMEYTSDGGLQNEPRSAYEFFAALSRQGKPVELYWYPKGEHALDTPFERMASLQRNVDWFRFWLQGYEGQAPSYDPEQYHRWRKLREQQLWNDRVRAQGKDPSTEFLRQTTPGAAVNDADRAPAARELEY